MGDGYHRHNGDRGLFSRLVGAGQYPPQGYPYPPPPPPPPGGYYSQPAGYPPHGGYPPPPPYVCPRPSVYSSAPYHVPSAACYPVHGGHKHGLGTFLAGGAAAMAAACGSHHTPHGYGSHGYGYYGHHHGRYKHGKFKHAKFGKRWKHKGMYGKHKMWK